MFQITEGPTVEKGYSPEDEAIDRLFLSRWLRRYVENLPLKDDEHFIVELTHDGRVVPWVENDEGGGTNWPGPAYLGITRLLEWAYHCHPTNMPFEILRDLGVRVVRSDERGDWW